MNILQLIENTGNSYKKKASTFGGEFSGPCPFCGGEDRFSIHPERDHFVCRRCRKAGDSIKFVREYHNQSYFEACSTLGITPTINYQSLDVAKDKPGQNEIVWKPRDIEWPPAIWQDKAAAILFESYKYLLSAAGKPKRDWLNARGISNNTIKKARMGWCVRSVSFDRETWGLIPEKVQSGKNKQIWLPEGLIIPYFRDGKPVRLRIRQADPNATDRFIMVAGSSMGYFDYTAHLGKVQDLSLPVLITEAELDGWLLYETVGDLFQIYAVGNVSARPDNLTHAIIKFLPMLLNLDNDTAGQDEIVWWQKQYTDHVLPWFAEFGKDVGEDFELGADIRAWGKKGLEKLKQLSIPQQQKPPITAQSFKDKIQQKIAAKKKAITTLSEVKAPSESIYPDTAIPFYSTVCLHNLYCQSLLENVCLIDQQNIYSDTKTCPKDQWTKHTSDSGIITQIVLSPGVKRT